MKPRSSLDTIPHRPETIRRRTFAIVSHPDAGKTTLTEKLLLYGGAVDLAGSVTARRSQRATTSDWMELERQRGISVSSTVLQFDYEGFRINLLDTPGHQDFSEDTFRVLSAVDSAVMVIDAAKGIEIQTRKLFDVCRRRGVPIFTFVNKLDRPCREPLALLDEVESVLGIEACAVNWPLGTGPDFRGVWDRQARMAHLYERTPRGAFRAPVSIAEISDPEIRDRMDDQSYATLVEEVEILDGAGARFDPDRIRAGLMTPVYFGSALNNFGVQLLLDGFLEHAPPPAPRRSRTGLISPDDEAFTGFVFKIQANMDPRHRDRIAFVRIVSGRFERDMSVWNTRTGQNVRLANAARIFGRDRETVEEAFPGDVVGIVSSARFAIGDTLSEDRDVVYDEIPNFAPECFGYIESTSPAQFKRFGKGLDQLLEEGVVQRFELTGPGRRGHLLGAVGPLQFEVVQYRLESEYGAASRITPAPWTAARWLDTGADAADIHLPSRSRLAVDVQGRRVVLLADDWDLHLFQERNPAVKTGAVV